MPTITTTTLAEHLIRGDRAALRANLPALQAALARALEVADQCDDEFMAKAMLWHLGMTLHWSDYRDASAPQTLAPNDRTRPAALPPAPLPPGGVLGVFDDEPSDGKVQDESQDGATRPAGPQAPHTQMHRVNGTAFVAKGAVPPQAAAAAIAAATRKGG